MASIRKNPRLTDYFVSCADTTKSIVPLYEAGNVLTFPDLKLDIDFAFWSSLPSDRNPALKKLRVLNDGQIAANVPGLDPQLRDQIEYHTRSIYAQALPAYQALFSPYRFIKKQGVLRLNRLVGLSLHIDSYAEVIPTHVARMFINLDEQPRIWHTSYTAQEAFKLASFTPEEHRTMPEADWWNALRYRALGGEDPTDCWDSHPRHICVFDPGDVWIVDSRQVAHQIFYGRRCLTIDFTVDRKSMLDPSRHYLGIVESLRRSALV